MNRSRRVAALMSFGAVATFLAVLAVTTQPVSARSCQQQCDAEHSAGLADCDANYPGDQECKDQVNAYYHTCSTGAYVCGGASFNCYTSPSMNCYYGLINGQSFWMCDPPAYYCACEGEGC